MSELSFLLQLHTNKKLCRIHAHIRKHKRLVQDYFEQTDSR